jgi:hypothetical protein
MKLKAYLKKDAPGRSDLDGHMSGRAGCFFRIFKGLSVIGIVQPGAGVHHRTLMNVGSD